MTRWTRIIGLSAAVFCLLVPSAEAAGLGRALVVSCDRDAREAIFEGRVTAFRKAKMQMRFTLQASTRDQPRFRRVDAEGWDEWITAPAVSKYMYDRTVKGLLPGSTYRTVIKFRWRDARGRTIRSERAVSPVCRIPDLRPDLVVRDVAHDSAGYLAVIFNRGRSAADPFDVAFIRGGVPLGSARVAGLAPGQRIEVFLPGPRCADGEALEAVADSRSEVDEANEENGSLFASC